MIVAFGILFAVCIVALGIRYRWYQPLDESLPSIHDSHVVAPDNLPLGTDLDTPSAPGDRTSGVTVGLRPTNGRFSRRSRSSG